MLKKIIGNGVIEGFIPDGLVLWHDYSEEDPIDKSGNGNDGTVVGAAYGGGGLVFDGAADYVQVADSAELRPGTGDFQLHIWLKSAVIQVNLDGYIITKGDMGGPPVASIWGSAITGGVINFFNVNATINIATAGGQNDNTLHLLSVIRSGTTARIYVDKVQQDEDATAGANLSSTATMYIGKNVGGSEWTGTMYEVMFATATKTLAEAEADMISVFDAGGHS